jgi:DNA-binding NarL/FixJ family response regulator
MEHQAVAPIKILIVDDHGIVREGLTALLNGQSTTQLIDMMLDCSLSGLRTVVLSARSAALVF